MKDLNQILMNKEYNPESKVYLIGKELKKEGRINDYLWYAILELKNKYIKDIKIPPDEDVNENGEPWYYELGAPIEMLAPEANKWVKGIIVPGYRYKNGFITMQSDSGDILCCFAGLTTEYRKPKE